MKLLLITIAAVLLVGYGSSMSFTEIISNPWALIGILTNYGIMLANLGIVLPVVFVLIIVGHFLLKFLFRKNKDEKIEELKAEGNPAQ